MDAVRDLYLVSCVRQKGLRRARARDLYQSTWFRLARDVVERTGSPWFILSARHGLVAPLDELEPYEETLNNATREKRVAWACRVQEQMENRMPTADRIVVFAGERYRENLVGFLTARTATVEVPMKGLRIGEQLSWLKERLRTP